MKRLGGQFVSPVSWSPAMNGANMPNSRRSQTSSEKNREGVERTSLNANYIENYLKILEDMIIMDQQFPNNISIPMTDPYVLHNHGVPFTIKKYPSHVSASIYHTYGSVMGMEVSMAVSKNGWLLWGKIPSINGWWHSGYPFFKGNLLSWLISWFVLMEILHLSWFIDEPQEMDDLGSSIY